jgi:hypothetical protein
MTNLGTTAPRRTATWLGAVLLASAAALMAHQLLVPPIIGLADNGDFDRVTRPLNLSVVAPPLERYVSWVWPTYRVERLPPRRYLSSELLVAAAARAAAALFPPRGRFDLRWMGATHAAALLVAAFFLWRESADLSLAARAAGFGFALLAFTDVGYVAPLNSFYTQAGSLVFLAATIAFGTASARRPGRLAPLAGYFSGAALFVASKPQEAIQAVPLALFGLFLARRGKRGVRVGGWALAASLLVVGVVLAAGTRGRFRDGALYKMVFLEILPRSPEPAADLRALGLPASDVRFSGTTNYDPDSPFRDPAVRARLFRSLSYPVLLRFFAARPGRAAAELASGAWAGWELRPPLGNFEKSAGLPAGARTRAYSAWTRIRRLALPAAGLLLVAIFAGNAGLAAFGRLPPAARAGLGTLVVAGALAYGVCTLASAHIEIVRKLYVFHAITDVLIAADLAIAAAAVRR